MKTVKHFTFITVLLTLACILSGCGHYNDGKKDVIEFGELEVLAISDFGKGASEYPLKTRFYHDASAESEISVEFNGVAYSGEYMRTTVWMYDPYPSHKYDGDKIYFEVKAGTRDVFSIHFLNVPTKTARLSESALRKIADDVADDHIVISNYKVDVTESDTPYEYIYDYCREISGYETSETLRIIINRSGEISYFSKRMIGSFDDVVGVVYDQDKAKEAIDEKMNGFYADDPAFKGYTVRNVVLTRLEDGSYGFLYCFGVDFEVLDESSGDIYSYGSIEYLLVKNRA